MTYPLRVFRLAALSAPLYLALTLGAPAQAVAGQAAAGQAVSAPACGDFLDKQGDKPGFIEYLGCHAEYEGQGKPLVARYRLDGAYAAQAEDFLRRRYGIARLRFVCCGWESTPHSWVDDGHAWNLVFASEETLLSARAQWARIPTFHIRVEQYTEDP